MPEILIENNMKDEVTKQQTGKESQHSADCQMLGSDPSDSSASSDAENNSLSLSEIAAVFGMYFQPGMIISKAELAHVASEVGMSAKLVRSFLNQSKAVTLPNGELLYMGNLTPIEKNRENKAAISYIDTGVSQWYQNFYLDSFRSFQTAEKHTKDPVVPCLKRNAALAFLQDACKKILRGGNTYDVKQRGVAMSFLTGWLN